MQHTCQNRKTLAIDNWPWHTPKVIAVAAEKWPYGISLTVCGLLFRRLYLGPFSRHYHFWSQCDWLWPWECLHFWEQSLNYKPSPLFNVSIFHEWHHIFTICYTVLHYSLQKFASYHRQSTQVVGSVLVSEIGINFHKPIRYYVESVQY